MTSGRDLVLASTASAAPPLVPEVVLRTTAGLTALWQALADGDEAVPPPFWAVPWVGGQVVARWVLDHPGEVAGRRVLDLAAGSGLCALAAARAGAASVLAVDVDPVAGEAVRVNAEANDLPVEVLVADLLDGPVPDGVEVVLAGDVYYDAAMAARFLPWLRAAAVAGCRVLLGDPGRDYLPRDGMTRLAAYDVPTTVELEGVPVKSAVVYAVTR